MIPEDFIQQLLERVDITDVVGQYVQLKKGGSNLLGLCPFHQEKTPSFTVSPSKQFYHCFGCGAHGTAIKFLMEHTGQSFPEAVKSLAQSVGMEVPQKEYSPSQKAKFKQQKTEKELLTDALNRAEQHYYDLLKRKTLGIEAHAEKRLNEAALYLKGRGISGQTAKKFRLGWSGHDRQSLATVFADYQSNEHLITSGLVIENQQGLRYDRFRSRVMFPIRNARGHMIGFGGRVLGKGQPKYLNSPETPLFNKSKELYGLWENRQSIRKAGQVLVVEGYMDVVSLANAGLDYAVATLGTATSGAHIQQLIKVSDRIVFSFDGDAAGQKAAWRALQSCLPLLQDDLSIRFLFLPAEHDPDSYVQAYGKAQFEDLLKNAQTLSSYLFAQLQQRYDLQQAEGRAACLHAFYDLWQQLPAINLTLQIQNELARLLQLTHDEMQQALWQRQQQQEQRQAHYPGLATSGSATATHSHQAAPANSPDDDDPFAALSSGHSGSSSPPPASRPSRYRSHTPSTPSRSRTTPLSKRLLTLLLMHPDLFEQINERQLEVLSRHPHLGLVVEFVAFVQSQAGRNLAIWMQQLSPQDRLYQVLLGLQTEASQLEPLPQPLQEWQDALRKIELENLLSEQQDLVDKGLQTDSARKRYQTLNARIRILK
ncbi:DNA primase [Brackiella oedipodis]|uniref:DNA primase n=1 Tax=Brackiella oedipodis TaxID=124225 RepID=UPI00048AFBB3|nr:DNA primase [Brackiella oedipodis]